MRYDLLPQVTSLLFTQNYAYDALGNITSRSDKGAYTYGAANGILPHAVTQIALAGGGQRNYSYDASGNLTAEVQTDASNNIIASAGRTESYTSFDMPKQLSTPSATLSFVYGPDHQRVKQISPLGTTIYLHPDNAGALFYEKNIKANGTIEHEHYITAGGGVVALIKQVSGANTVYYFHRDNLGSTTAMTDAAGNLVERFAYEPFGKRRFPQGQQDPNNTIAGITTNRGFTNHEELDQIGLVHMNGRVYDPGIGRFLSADPTIPHKFSIQSYNRYSYVQNNPLTATDPNGYCDGDGCWDGGDGVMSYDGGFEDWERAFYGNRDHVSKYNVDDKSGDDSSQTVVITGKRGGDNSSGSGGYEPGSLDSLIYSSPFQFNSPFQSYGGGGGAPCCDQCKTNYNQ